MLSAIPYQPSPSFARASAKARCCRRTRWRMRLWRLGHELEPSMDGRAVILRPSLVHSPSSAREIFARAQRAVLEVHADAVELLFEPADPTPKINRPPDSTSRLATASAANGLRIGSTKTPVARRILRVARRETQRQQRIVQGVLGGAPILPLDRIRSATVAYRQKICSESRAIREPLSSARSDRGTSAASSLIDEGSEFHECISICGNFTI